MVDWPGWGTQVKMPGLLLSQRVNLSQPVTHNALPRIYVDNVAVFPLDHDRRLVFRSTGVIPDDIALTVDGEESSEPRRPMFQVSQWVSGVAVQDVEGSFPQPFWEFTGSKCSSWSF